MVSVLDKTKETLSPVCCGVTEISDGELSKRDVVEGEIVVKDSRVVESLAVIDGTVLRVTVLNAGNSLVSTIEKVSGCEKMGVVLTLERIVSELVIEDGWNEDTVLLISNVLEGCIMKEESGVGVEVGNRVGVMMDEVGAGVEEMIEGTLVANVSTTVETTVEGVIRVVEGTITVSTSLVSIAVIVVGMMDSIEMTLLERDRVGVSDGAVNTVVEKLSDDAVIANELSMVVKSILLVGVGKSIVSGVDDRDSDELRLSTMLALCNRVLNDRVDARSTDVVSMVPKLRLEVAKITVELLSVWVGVNDCVDVGNTLIEEDKSGTDDVTRELVSIASNEEDRSRLIDSTGVGVLCTSNEEDAGNEFTAVDTVVVVTPRVLVGWIRVRVDVV